MIYFKINIFFILNGVFAESFQELYPCTNDKDRIEILKGKDQKSLSHVSSLKPEGKICV